MTHDSTDAPPARRRLRSGLPAMDPAPEPGAAAAPSRGRRRRVFVTGGLAASAAVLAMSVQSGQVTPVEDGIAPCASCGDPALDLSVDGAGGPGALA